MRLTLLLTLCSFLPLELRATEPDPLLPYSARKLDPVIYDVDYSVIVTAPNRTQKLRVWLPIPPTDAAQEIGNSELTTFPLNVAPKLGTEKVFGNRFAYFEFDQPQGAQIIRHSFRIKVWELQWDIDPKQLTRINKWPDSFSPYLKGDRSIIVDDPIRRFARELNDLDTAMEWLNTNMTYDPSKASLIADAKHAFDQRTGDCGEYHGLCASFGRVLGLPTRMTYGISPFPKNSPSHCKLEVYLAPRGWVSFDISETQKLVQSIEQDASLKPELKQRLMKEAKDRLRSGFRDNTWYLQTRGTDYELEPPASQKARVVRTIYAEADGKALPEPNPSDPSKREFAWMTAHRYTADREVKYPFRR